MFENETDRIKWEVCIMSSIAETVSPFTMEEEIIYCQKFTSVYKEHQHDSAASREAACLEVQYPACMCPPQPGDLLVGRYYHPLVLFSPQACSSLGYCFDEAKLRRWENSGQLGYAQRRDLSELEAFWKYENTNQYIRSHDTPLMKQWLSHEDFTKDRAVAYSLYRLSGTHQDFGTLLKYGVDGLHERITEKQAYADAESLDFYDGLHRVLNTFSRICQYYAEEIEALLQSESTDPAWKTELEEMKACVAHIAHAPASSFREAIQLTYLWWVYSGSANFGRMDTYLGEYYVHDVDHGMITEQRAQDLLLALWNMMVLKNQVYDCRIFVGGKGRKNEAVCDRFALPAIQTTRRFHDVVPQLSLRIYKGMNEKVYDAALEAALFHGKDAETGEQIGIDTGGLETYASFEDLLDAYKKQVEHFVALLAKMEEAEYVYASRKCAFLTFSLLFDDCIARGKPLLGGGVRYLGGTLESYGNVNTADSLTAIKQLVFDEKKLSAQELLTALRTNFKGMPMVHPERHKDLIVRVGGFSARFIDLGLDVQQELLSRTLHGGN